MSLAVGVLSLFLAQTSAAQDMSKATENLFDAVHNGDLAQVQISIAGGADINAMNTWGITPVDLAVDKGHFDIVHFLLQVRDLQKSKVVRTPPPAPATVTPLGDASASGGSAVAAKPSPPLQPVPKAAPVGEVYTPPPGADPWSATVVTSEPPAPPPPSIPAGPSPFDEETPLADSSLPIIGTVRGPDADEKAIDTSTQNAVEEAYQEVVSKPAPVTTRPPVPQEQAKQVPELAPKAPEPKIVEQVAIVEPEEKKSEPEEDESGVWEGIKNFLSIGDETEETSQAAVNPPSPAKLAKSEPAPEKITPMKPVEQPRKSVVQAKPTAPVSPPNVTGPPPPIEGKMLPKNVTTAPLHSLNDDDLDAPKVVPVQPKPEQIAGKSKAKTNKNPEPKTPTVKVTKITEADKTTAKQIAKSEKPKTPVKVGTTSLPGKPREQKGFFSKVMSVFSSDEDEKKEEKTVTTSSQTSSSGDWSVKQIQQAQVVPRKPAKKPGRDLPKNRLDGVILSLGRTTALGKEPPPQMPAPWYYKSCVSKRQGSMMFCIEPLEWPEDIMPHFLTDSVMYEGARSIVRYDEGAATYYHTLFPSKSYATIVKFFTRRYGKPSQKLTRSIAPLAEKRRTNPTVIWRSIAPVTNLLTTLEVRQYDDNRGGFPDTKRGAVYLYHEWSQPVFPQLSSVELMLLRAEEKQR